MFERLTRLVELRLNFASWSDKNSLKRTDVFALGIKEYPLMGARATIFNNCDLSNHQTIWDVSTNLDNLIGGKLR